MTIKEAREHKNMSQVELAVAAGVALGTIARMENGLLEKASVANFLKVCKALECDPADFLCSK